MTAIPWADLLGWLGQRRTLLRWRKLLGEHFDSVAGCIARTGAPVRFVACPECGCNHKVLQEESGGFYAVCTCEHSDCDDILLRPEQAEAWVFDPLLFGRMVQTQLGTLGEIGKIGNHAVDLGSCPRHDGGGGGHVLLLYGVSEDVLREVPELAVRKSVGCVLLSSSMSRAEKLLLAGQVPTVRIGDVCPTLASGLQASCSVLCKRLPRDLTNREVVEQLRPPIYELGKAKEELAQRVAEKDEEIGRMATDPAGAVAKIAAGFKTEGDRNLFNLLIHTTEKSGKQTSLSYAGIGERMGGISKQAVEKRVRAFRRDNPQPWRYVETVRKPAKARAFSELGPKKRRSLGIDENYGFGA